MNYNYKKRNDNKNTKNATKKLLYFGITKNNQSSPLIYINELSLIYDDFYSNFNTKYLYYNLNLYSGSFNLTTDELNRIDTDNYYTSELKKVNDIDIINIINKTKLKYIVYQYINEETNPQQVTITDNLSFEPKTYHYLTPDLSPNNKQFSIFDSKNFITNNKSFKNTYPNSDLFIIGIYKNSGININFDKSLCRMRAYFDEAFKNKSLDLVRGYFQYIPVVFFIDVVDI